MGIIDEIKRMRQEGIPDQDIILNMKQRGLSQKEIDNALTQTQIKEAIVDNQAGMTGYQPSFPMAPEPEAMQDAPAPSPEQYQQYQQAPAQVYPQEAYPEQQYPGYDNSQYSQYAPQISSDTINEIAEQVVAEKLSKIRSQVEKLSDLKVMAETRISSVDERLKRIEKIIDSLQLSILQKIGQYASNVSDLKKELTETQKSFKAVSKTHHHESKK